MDQNINSNVAAAPKKGALVSHATVLILAGVLIGLTMSNTIAPTMRMQIFACGAIGVVAYFGMAMAHRQRRKLVEKKQRCEILHQLEARVEQHIPAKRQEERALVSDAK